MLRSVWLRLHKSGIPPLRHPRILPWQLRMSDVFSGNYLLGDRLRTRDGTEGALACGFATGSHRDSPGSPLLPANEQKGGSNNAASY